MVTFSYFEHLNQFKKRNKMWYFYDSNKENAYGDTAFFLIFENRITVLKSYCVQGRQSLIISMSYLNLNFIFSWVWENAYAQAYWEHCCVNKNYSHINMDNHVTLHQKLTWHTDNVKPAWNVTRNGFKKNSASDIQCVSSFCPSEQYK